MLTYNSYLKVPELLELQAPLSKPSHHDEMLFIVIHQTYELWFKQILHELDKTIAHMRFRQILDARHFANRAAKIIEHLVGQIHLLETMRPVDFLQFRDSITPASGFQSSQFRELEFLLGIKDEKMLDHFKGEPQFFKVLKRRMQEPDLRMTYLSLLDELGLGKTSSEAIAEIYQNPSGNLPLYLLSESLVDLDEQLMLWRDHHVRVIERIIGFKQGTGGSSGVQYLKTTVDKKAFPELWEIRTYLSKGSASAEALGCPHARKSV